MKEIVYDIVIPSWNMSEMAIKCLLSIEKHSKDYRVIFVDNGSEQEELDKILLVLNKMPHKLIRNETNLGFVKATNAGISASEAPYVVLMNNDTEAVPGWLEKLSHPLRNNKEIMVSGPLTTTPDSWQGSYPKNRIGYVIRERGMLAFFCALFNRKIFEEVGILDERFGLGFGDDDDYCRRILTAGYKMALVQDLIIPHHHRSTFKKLFPEDKIKELQKEAIQKFYSKYETYAGKHDRGVKYEGKVIDLVYVLGTGSVWKNNELRFSLRSVAKNMVGVGNIWIIGENPGFLSNEIRHIYYPDELGKDNADGNMARKILRACKEPDLSEDFVFMNDDFIINKPLIAAEIPCLHKGDMKNRPPEFWTKEKYRKRLRRTFDVLMEKGYPTIQYDYHAPMIMSKTLFPACMENFDYANDIGFTFRSLYGNYCRIPASPIGMYKKTVYGSMKPDDLRKHLKDCVFAGFNDNGLNSTLKLWLNENFPTQCLYETNGCNDILINISDWLAGDRDYDEGVILFERIFKNVNLVRLFRHGKSQQLQEKLEYKLKMFISSI